jgi:cell division protein FtsB
VTTNTYNKSKESNKTLASSGAKTTRAGIHTGNVRTSSPAVNKARTEEQSLEAKRRAEAKRRELAHTKPEAIRLRLPAILGFDTREKFITKTATAVNKHPIVLAILVTLLLTVMFMFVVVNAVDVNKIKIETTRKSSLLNELIERDAELSLEIEKIYNPEYIRERAKNDLGMIDKKNVTKYHISMDNADEIIIVGGESSDPTN